MFNLEKYIVDQMVSDPLIDEIMFNGCRSVVTYRSNIAQVGKSLFKSTEKAISKIQEFSFDQGSRLDPNSPSAGGLYLETYRWHAVIPPASHSEALLSVRRHRLKDLDLIDFKSGRSTYQTISKYFSIVPTVIFGDTGAGKSSFLACLLKKYSFNERLVVIEQIPELSLLSSTWIRLNAVSENIFGVGKYSLICAVSDALRLRPDRIVLGEYRNEESDALNMIARIGHAPFVWTMHAGSTNDIRLRLGSIPMRKLLAIHMENFCIKSASLIENFNKYNN